VSAMCPTTTTVDANAYPPTDSGLVLAAGQSVVIDADGQWSVGGPYGTFDANGATSFATEGCALNTSAPMGALLGSLDCGGTWFRIGSGPTLVSGPGTLLFAANDCPGNPPGAFFVDNSGTLSVTIRWVATTKGACMKGGWASLVDAQGNPFRNQGQCVKSIETTRGFKRP